MKLSLMLLFFTFYNCYCQIQTTCKLERLYSKNNNLKIESEIDTEFHCFCGTYKEFDSTGVLLIEGNYKKIDSVECKECYDIEFNQNIKGEREAIKFVKVNNIKIGEWKYYHSNGKLKAIGKY